jgi:hypothetical protein
LQGRIRDPDLVAVRPFIQIQRLGLRNQSPARFLLGDDPGGCNEPIQQGVFGRVGRRICVGGGKPGASVVMILMASPYALR